MEFMTSLQAGVDELKPSLFELLAEQQLSALLPPTIRYLLAVATHRHPRYLIRALNKFDELYALLSVLLERHFLRTYGGSFTENFYGLKRARVLKTKGGEIPRAQIGAASAVRDTLKLRDRDVWANLAVLIGLPYIKRKLDESWDIHAAPAQANILGGPGGFGRSRDTLPPDATLKQRIMFYYKWFLRRVYPSVNAAYYFALLAFNVAYLVDLSKYHSPWLWLIGTRIRRMGHADYQAIEAAATAAATAREPKPSTARPGQNNSIFNPRTLALTVYPRLFSSIRILLPTSIFALKFLEWWHASDFARQLSRKANEGLELPPPIISQPPTVASSPADNKKSSDSLASPSKAKAKANILKHRPPISATTHLPVLTVTAPTPETSSLCPICVRPIVTATASPYGYVYCYVCIHKWVEGIHERQEAFMEGSTEEEKAWGNDEDDGSGKNRTEGSREGKWESGRGRCAVTGKRVLGGTEVLRRVVA